MINCIKVFLFYQYGNEDDTVFETIADKVASWFQSQKANVGITSTTISSPFPTSIGSSKLSKVEYMKYFLIYAIFIL